MNITKQQSDALNAIITINIEKADYAEKTNKALNDYRKNASITGFRKGHIPMSIIKNRYGKAILFDEINKILQQSLDNYINNEKIDILGNPIPVAKTDIDWEADNFSFDFEIGLVPEFSVDLNIKNNVHYKIKIEDEFVNKQIEYVQKKYGEIFPKEQYEPGDELTGIFSSDFEKINRKVIISQNIYNKKTSKKLEKLGNLRSLLTVMPFNNFIFNEGKNVADKFIGKKINDIITFSAKELFPKFSDLIEYFGISPDTQEQDFNISFTISEINGYQLAEANQDFFDTIYEKGKVTSLEQMKQIVITNYQTEYKNYTDPKFFNDTFAILIENTKFDLPAEFLKKWLQQTAENPLSDQQVEEQYNKSEEQLRYQLIEQKIMTENNLQITFDELKKFASERARMKISYKYQGNIALEQLENEIEQEVKKNLSDPKEYQTLVTNLRSAKIFDLFVEKTVPDIKEVSFDEFMAISKKE